MYYITKKDSETGTKFQKIMDKIEQIKAIDRALAKEIGFNKWRKGFGCAFGGFSSLIFDEKPNPKIYKQVNGDEWMPKLSCKEGKRIMAKLNSTPEISNRELNMCIDVDDPFRAIGFAWGNESLFGFIVWEEWDFPVPEDCEEVTRGRYNELFRK